MTTEISVMYGSEKVNTLAECIWPNISVVKTILTHQDNLRERYFYIRLSAITCFSNADPKLDLLTHVGI